MKLVDFITTAYETEVLINPDHVAQVYVDGDGITTIELAAKKNDEVIVHGVEGTLDEVRAKLES